MASRPCEVCGSDSFNKLFSKEGQDYYQCGSCGLIRLDPQPTDEVLGSIYGGHYYRAWGVEAAPERVFNLKKLTFTKHVFPHTVLPAGARILDCGAAFGALMSAAADQGWKPYGIELADEAAREIAQRFGPDRVYSGPFEKAEFPGVGPGEFDAIYMCDFIEHVRNPEAVLRKALELLHPGGYLAITTPDGGSASCRLMGSAWLHYKTEHLHYFNQKNLPMLLQKIGMTTRVSQSASKVLNFDYIGTQLRTYPRAILTPVMNMAHAVMGQNLRERPLSFSFGEMVVVAVKN